MKNTFENARLGDVPGNRGLVIFPRCRRQLGAAVPQLAALHGALAALQSGKCGSKGAGGVRVECATTQECASAASQARMAPLASTFNMPGHSSAQTSTSLPVNSPTLTAAGRFVSLTQYVAKDADWGGRLYGDSHQCPAGHKFAGRPAVNPRAPSPSGLAGCTVFITQTRLSVCAPAVLRPTRPLNFRSQGSAASAQQLTSRSASAKQLVSRGASAKALVGVGGQKNAGAQAVGGTGGGGFDLRKSLSSVSG